MIARAAEGSARDSLSLLDQAIAHGAGAIQAEDVRAMLGLADRARVIDLFETLMAGRTAEALDLLKRQYDIGADPSVVLQDLAAFTHQVTRFKVVGEPSDQAALPESERQRAAALAGTISLRVLSRAWQMLLKGIEEVATSSRPLAAADMVLIRVAHVADLPTPDEALRMLKSGAATSAPPSSPPPSAPPPPAAPRGTAALRSLPSSEPSAMPMAQPSSPAPSAKAVPAIRFQRFEDLVAYVGQKRDVPLKIALETQVRVIRFDDTLLEFEPVDGAARSLAAEIGRKVSEWTGTRFSVVLGRGASQPTIAEAREALKVKARSDARADPLVAAVLARFPGAEIVDVQIRAEEGADMVLPTTGMVPTDNPDEAPDDGED